MALGPGRLRGWVRGRLRTRQGDYRRNVTLDLADVDRHDRVWPTFSVGVVGLLGPGRVVLLGDH